MVLKHSASYKNNVKGFNYWSLKTDMTNEKNGVLASQITTILLLLLILRPLFLYIFGCDLIWEEKTENHFRRNENILLIARESSE